MNPQKGQKTQTTKAYTWGIGLTMLSFIVAGCGTTAAAASPNAVHSGTSAKSNSTASSVSLEGGNALVQGKKTQVLQSSQGMTLYYFTKDTPTQSNCTNAHNCDKIWHALTTSNRPASAAQLPGKLTIVKDVHGKQLSYNGHLLYLYSGDTKPGQALGEGFLHTWWVVTPTLKPLTAASSSSNSKSGTSNSGNSSYGSGGSSSSSSNSSSSSGW